MREHLEPKQKGDRIKHEEYNLIADVTNRFAGIPGWLHGKGIYANVDDASLFQTVVEITEINVGGMGVHVCKYRYWDRVAKEWVTTAATERLLDASGVGQTLAVGDQLTAWWSEQRGMFIPSGSAKSDAWYQLVTDLDGSATYLGYANPGTLDLDTGFLTDPHALDDPPIDPDWSIVAIDGTGQQPCWAGDWIKAEPLSFRFPSPYEEYSVVQITRRSSAQLQFWAVLALALPWGGSAPASVLINGNWRSKYIYDGGLLLATQQIPLDTLIVATYFPDLRRFFVTNTSCGKIETIP